MLCYLFSDTRRVFTNPRAGSRGARMSSFVQSVGNPADDTTSSQANDTDKSAISNAPLAVQACVASAMAGPYPTFVWPYGQSAGSARRADETPDEYETWKRRRTSYLTWRDSHYPMSITPVDELDGHEGGQEKPAAAAHAPTDDAQVANEASGAGPSSWAHPGAEKLTFKELYIEALMNSGKCTKSMREKCFLDEEYAEDFSKVCLLVNVGRINTTLAFYPEMKTILRSYHPVPSLQKSENTRRNMQDAPRMKSLLKAVLLPHERPGPPGGSSTASASAKHVGHLDTEEVPADIAETARRLRLERRPPTSVVTLIFLLTHQASDIMSLHFPPPFDMHSLFFPQASHPVSAKHRANVFLWLLYHYLEGPAALPPGAPGSENPFDDDVSRAARRQARTAWIQQGSVPPTDANPLWRGTPNPEYRRWRELYDHPNDANGDSGTSSSSSSRRPARKRAADVDDPDTPPCPESHTDRLLVPAMPYISSEAYMQEDADPPEEVAWGKQMQEERAAFLVRFQEEEQAKVLAQSGILDDPEHGRSDEAKPKKRIPVNTQSCYPLANILANAAAAGSHAGALTRSPIGFVKRARLSSRHSHPRDHRLTPSESQELDVEHTSDAAGALEHGSFWDLDLSAASHEPQQSMVQHAWDLVKAHEDFDSDTDAHDDHDDEQLLVRQLLVLRRTREARGESESSAKSATEAAASSTPLVT